MYLQNYLRENPNADSVLSAVAYVAERVSQAGLQGAASGGVLGGGANFISYANGSYNDALSGINGESFLSRVDRITAILQGKFNQQIDSLNNFLWNQTSPSFNPYSQPAFALAGGPAFNTQINSDTSNTTRSHNKTTTNTTSTNAAFDLSINSNTGILSGLQARNLETSLNDKLAAFGRTVTPGDLYAVTVRRGKYQDGVPYQVGQKIQPAGDGSVTHILEAFGVSAGGETINFKRVTADALRKIERGAAEGENVAEAAGDGEGDGEYSIADSTKVTPQDISRFNFNKYLRDLIGPPPADMVDPHAHHILFKEGNGSTQKELAREGQAILIRNGIDPIFGHPVRRHYRHIDLDGLYPEGRRRHHPSGCGWQGHKRTALQRTRAFGGGETARRREA